METDILPPSGFLLVDKPTEWTSHDVVGYLRGVTKIKKIGHAGTLDPFATGLLIVGIGREATKRIDEFKGMKKIYVTSIQLGAISDTQDCTGVLSDIHENIPVYNKEDIEAVLQTFMGEHTQIPPMYSAKKVAGKKLYELARAGKTVERAPCEITIHTIELINVDSDTAVIDLRCTVSTGTYIRTLAHDIGQALGVGAYCKTLRRTHIGDYTVDDAIPPKSFEKDSWEKRLLQVPPL
ncbi:tRNA pseudouridine(55) synthase TruB [Patescibacteria group bacterium]|nr:tRNA pseudouridine(55) synthase TruB [Patescibacteria group bacterium]MBU1721944.1 tRNA pseudouridine(55) synthase TruB [Patescibacteria group bacterium]MBU1901784.1 tRNA pseudouridine(55) synthase TruB [Patescibacteria group bacterium]